VGSRDGLYLAVSAAVMSVFLSAELHAPWSIPNIYSDITGSFWGRDWVQAGTLPYLHSFFEYPVLSGLLTYAARQLGDTVNGFYTAFSAFSLLAAASLGWSCWAVAKKLGRELNPLFFLMPSFVIYGVYNFDLFHAALIMLSILAYLSRRAGISAGVLGLAVDLKLTSAVLLPVFLIDLKTRKERLKYLAEFAAVVVAFNVPFVLMNFSVFLQGYQFNGSYGLEDVWTVWIFQNPASWGFAKALGLGVGALLLLRVYTLKVSFEAKAALAISAYLLGTFIYSPQFDLLLIPLLAVLDLKHPAVFPWDTFNALIILTWFVQPSYVLGGACPDSSLTCPTLAGTWAQLFSLLRDVCLVWLSLSIASREGASATAWLRRHLGLVGDDGPEPVGQETLVGEVD
jgi:Glycosyltransferase family 87